MLREGMTGDWIGTFIGHKGAVWQSRLSSTASHAVTGSADFTAKVWDPYSGECLHTLQHNHIVRAVSFVPGADPKLVATGGFEKKLRIFDLSDATAASNGSTSASNGSTSASNGSTSASNGSTSASNGSSPTTSTSAVPSHEIGAGVHGGTIKSIVWGPDNHIIVSAAEDKVIRWWDLRQPAPINTFTLEGPLGSCELNLPAGSNTNEKSILSVAAGKTAYFFSGTVPGELITSYQTGHDIASVAVNVADGKFVTGGNSETWVRVYDFNNGKEMNVYKGHHGPVWSTSFSPDGKICATGSEDGTIKLWKFATDAYGLWR